jgi:hypothetical protein
VTKDKAKEAFGMLSYFANSWKTKYGKVLTINKYKEKWAMISLIEDFGEDQVEKAINYYFTLSKDGHPLVWFYNNCDTILKTLTEQQRDDKLRAERREQMKKLKEEFYNANA